MSKYIIFTNNRKKNFFIVFLFAGFITAFVTAFYFSAKFTNIIRTAVFENVSENILMNHYDLFIKVWMLMRELIYVTILLALWFTVSFLTVTVYNKFINNKKQ